MENTIGQRIRLLREAKGLSVADFAKGAGVKPSAIYNLESDQNKPSVETVGSLCLTFPDLNPDWLLLGTGSMLRDGRALAPAETENPDPRPGLAAPGMRIVRLTYEELVAENADLHRKLATRTNEVVDMLNDEVKRLRLKKGMTSAEAADLRQTASAIAQEVPVYVTPGFTGGVHRQLSA